MPPTIEEVERLLAQAPSEQTFFGFAQVFRVASARFFLEHVAPGSHILDVGAGDGGVAWPLAKQGCKVDCIDLRPHRVAFINAHRGDLDIRAWVADFFEEEFEFRYDYVIARQFVSHFDDWQSVMLRMRDLVRVGGKLAIHHTATEPFDISRVLSRTEQQRDAIEAGYAKSGNTTLAELEAFVERHQMTLEHYQPINMLAPSNVLFRNFLTTKKAQKTFGDALNDRLRSDEVRQFVLWLETELFSQMPPGLSVAYMALLRRDW